MHFCCNVVTGAAGDGQAVLLRALEPIAGLDEMRAARAAASSREPTLLRDRDLCSGPAKLCQAMSIGRAHNGADLLAPASTLRLEAPPGFRPLAPEDRPASARIGLSKHAGEWAARPWRWHAAGNPYVSRTSQRLPRGSGSRCAEIAQRRTPFLVVRR